MDELNKIRKYEEILAIIKTLNSSKSSQEILNNLLKKSVELVSNGDTGLIFLYNKEKKYLEVKSSYGFNPNSYKIIIRENESITGRAFKENRPIIANNSEEVIRYMEGISFYSDNELRPEYYLGKNISDIKGVIACPIPIRDECIGVLVIDNFSKESTFNDFDMEIVELISSQAGLAIEKARNLENEKRKNMELDRYSRIIEKEKDRYKHGMTIHLKFMDMILNGGSIEDLIREISKLVESDLIFVDRFNNVCSKNISSDISGDDIAGIVEACLIKHRDDSNIFEFKDYMIRIQKIIVDKEDLGFLILINKGYKYSEELEITLERGITVLALEIFKNREIEILEENYRGDFIDSLISHENKATIEWYSNKYNIDFTRNKRLILLEFLDFDPKYNTSIRESFKNSLEGVIFKSSIEAFLAYKLENIFIIVPGDAIDKGDIETFMNKIFEIEDRLNKHSMSLRGIVGDLFLGSENFSKVYSDCKRVLRQKKRSNSSLKWSFYSESKVNKIILNTGEDELKKFTYEILGELLKDKNNRELLKTLKTYIRNCENWTKTKEDLFIHGNTLTQRLNRISEILGSNIKDYYERLYIQVALEIIDLYPEYYK